MPNEKPDSFQCGPFEVARNPDVRAFVEKLNRLREEVDKNRICDGVGYTYTRSSGGTTLSIKGGSSSGQPPFEHPFRLQVRKNIEQYEFFVTRGTVGSGLAPVINQNQWVAFSPNQPESRVYLEAAISNLQIQSLTLKTQAADAELARTVITDGQQSLARISIGLFVPTQPGGTDYRVIQNVTTEIMTPLFCFNGYPAIALTQEFVNAYYT